MDKKLVIALVALFMVVVLGAILIAWPAPIQNGSENTTDEVSTTEMSKPFTSANVRVSSPLPEASVRKTFIVEGEARGTWFFEASFPIFVVTPNSAKVGQGIAQAQSEWMTEDFVPFTAEVVVENYSGPATLVLLKDNPSGLPEHDDAVEFPIVVQ